MTDKNSTTGGESETTDSVDAAATSAVTIPPHKVLGRFSDGSGVSVYGLNEASNGTPIGVEGSVPNGDGYGLATDNDARVKGDVDTDETDFVVNAGTTSTNDAQNVVMGHESNSVADGELGATISGGGFDTGFRTIPNEVQESYGTVGGGVFNVVEGSYGTISGGEDNVAGGRSSTVGGGLENAAKADFSTIAGGGSTEPDTQSESITNNVVYDKWGTIGGGGNNQAGSDNNTTDDTYATVSGGKVNEASGKFSTVSGGTSNTATKKHASIGGGKNSDASGRGSTVCGGEKCDATQDFATSGGGYENDATGYAATTGGGYNNEAGNTYATVPGGQQNEASGDSSFAAGQYAKAVDDHAFVWADGTTDSSLDPVNFSSSSGLGPTGSATFSARATGGVRFGTGTDSTGTVNVGVKVGSGSGSWSSLSTRTAKSNVRPTDPEAVLDGVEDLEINRWEYDASEGVDHMGPMAEEFYDAFGLGDDDRHITNVDADGVLFAAVQALSKKLDEKEERLADLEADLAALRDRVTADDD